MLTQYKPWWLRGLSVLDDICYRHGAPHLLDLLLSALALALVLLVVNQ